MQCPKCGYENKEGTDYCGLCKNVLVKTKTAEIVDVLFIDERQKQILVDARARIFWGHPESEVRTWLQSQEITQEHIESFLTLSLRNYSSSLLKKGMSDLVLGLILFTTSLSIIIVVFQIKIPKIFQWRIATYLVLVGFYGIWLSGGGIGDIIHGRSILERLVANPDRATHIGMKN